MLQKAKIAMKIIKQDFSFMEWCLENPYTKFRIAYKYPSLSYVAGLHVHMFELVRMDLWYYSLHI